MRLVCAGILAAIKSFSPSYPKLDGSSIERLDPALDDLIAADATVEKLAEGFTWSEGPVWVRNGGFLLFTDIPANTIYRWRAGEGVTAFMKPSSDQGANGLTLDKQGNLMMAQHGHRRIARLVSWSAPNGPQNVVAARFQGKRFNSPNDLIVHPSGDIYFTDPPYGLAKQDKDPARELAFHGVFRLDRKGNVTLVTGAIERPNGIGLSPDGRILYASNSYGQNAVIMAFGIETDGSTGSGRVLFDATEMNRKAGKKGAFDGLRVDRTGHIWATNPGGVMVISPAGKHLGTIVTGRPTANCEFGDGDGSTLYITAQSFLARVKTRAQRLNF